MVDRLVLLVVAFLCIAALPAMYLLRPYALVPFELSKDRCSKAVEQEHSKVDYDCMVAEYTERLAVVTYFLVGATGILGFATFLAAFAAMNAARHIPTVERAFVHGGVHPDGRSFTSSHQEIRVRFSVANYGKTPAFIKYVEIGSGKLDGLSDEPKYSKPVPVSDLYFPMMTMNDLRYPDDVEVTIPADGKHVVFQRVFYEDIFKKSHSSGSLHRIYVKDGVIKDEIISNKPKYWRWD